MLLLILLTVPFFVNDLLFYKLGENALLIDYALRAIVIVSIFKIFRLRDLGFQRIRFDLLTLFLIILIPVGIYLFGPFLKELTIRIPWTPLESSFSIKGNLRLLDQILGVSLIALSEELLFRGLYPFILRKINPNTMIFLGSLIYAFAHWSGGVAQMIVVFIWGLLAFILRFQTKNIIPLLLSHFIFKLILTL